jgi:dienelactone hydrolase
MRKEAGEMTERTQSEPAERSVQIWSRGEALEGNLTIPAKARGIVLFAHGSGSSRHSPRNRFVAKTLNGEGLATLLMDLLTAAEEEYDVVTRRHRFNIRLLAARLLGAMEWIQQQPETKKLRIGLFGASTGAAAALVAAGEAPDAVGAVVSRGGRPDLAGEWLSKVTAPTLLIVGGADQPVIELNEQALERLRSEKRLEIVPGATHLFSEPGTLERVATMAGDWFVRHLTNGSTPTHGLAQSEPAAAPGS